MDYLADIFAQFKSNTDRDGEISLSVAFVWENRTELRTLLEIIVEGRVDQFSSSEGTFKFVGRMCKSKGTSSCVIINGGRVRFVPSDMDEDDRYFERPDFYPAHMSQAMVQLVWIDFWTGKEPLKKLSVYRLIGGKLHFESLIDSPLQPEDNLMVKAVRGGYSS